MKKSGQVFFKIDCLTIIKYFAINFGDLPEFGESYLFNDVHLRLIELVCKSNHNKVAFVAFQVLQEIIMRSHYIRTVY